MGRKSKGPVHNRRKWSLLLADISVRSSEIRIVTFLTQASTFPNSEGEVIKRIITKVTADELTYINPANVSGVRVEAVWTRVK
jgi:hypothetical protein